MADLFGEDMQTTDTETEVEFRRFKTKAYCQTQKIGLQYVAINRKGPKTTPRSFS